MLHYLGSELKVNMSGELAICMYNHAACSAAQSRQTSTQHSWASTTCRQWLPSGKATGLDERLLEPQACWTSGIWELASHQVALHNRRLVKTSG